MMRFRHVTAALAMVALAGTLAAAQERGAAPGAPPATPPPEPKNLQVLPKTMTTAQVLPIMRNFAPVIFDGTHSVQTPSAANGVSGGQPEFIPVLARAAVAAGVDGIFLEVHDDPQHAKSDGANALHLNRLRGVLETLLALHQTVKGITS